MWVVGDMSVCVLVYGGCWQRGWVRMGECVFMQDIWPMWEGKREDTRGAVYFQTLTIPSLDDVTMKPWVVWKVAMSVMMSWWPTGRDSGPLRGASSIAPLFCLLWISYREGQGQQVINAGTTKRITHITIYHIQGQSWHLDSVGLIFNQVLWCLECIMILCFYRQ